MANYNFCQLSLSDLAGRLLKVLAFFKLRFLISNFTSLTSISWKEKITISTVSLIFKILGCLAYF